MKMAFYTCILTIAWQFCLGQALNPVEWAFDSRKMKGDTILLELTAEIDDGWYIYSQFLDEGGPIPTSFNFHEGTYELVGETGEKGEKVEGYDDLFQMNLVKYAGQVRFSQHITLTKPTGSVTGTLTFMTCDDSRCLPPREVHFDIDLN